MNNINKEFLSVYIQLILISYINTSEMKINSAKTKILVCARNLKIKADVYINSQKLEQVDENMIGTSREQNHSRW